MQYGPYSKKDKEKFYFDPFKEDKKPKYDKYNINFRWNQFSKVALIYNVKSHGNSFILDGAFHLGKIFFLEKSYQNEMKRKKNATQLKEILGTTD